MPCEEYLHQLNARADGELPVAEAAQLDAHLAECSDCRAAAEGLATIDAELRRAFAPTREAAARLAASTVARMRAGASAPVSPAPPAPPSPRFAWENTVLAMAAGFLLAVALFRPWQEKSASPFVPLSVPQSVPLSMPFAHVATATGPVEVRLASQLPVMRCPTGGPIQRDSIVRTGPNAQCEISMQDGTALRLDCNTEVRLHAAEVIEVNRGRLWSCGPAGCKPVEIQSAAGTIVAGEAAQVAVDCQPQAMRLIVVDGAAQVRTDGKSVEVDSGKQVRIVQGKIENNPMRCDTLLETAWVNNLVALRGEDDPELADRVNKLLAQIGEAKLSLLYEDELRRLGDSGVPPLIAYLAATRETPQLDQRATAARNIADVAEARWIGDLIALLIDANADVRFHAARGLQRLTGRDQACEPRAWQSGDWETCAGPYQKWAQWWTANRDLYPSARRDIPAPQAAPF